MAKISEDLDAIRTIGLRRFIYIRFIYRHHMRIIHKRGWHYMRALYPMGGPSFCRCDWCGHTEQFALDGYLRNAPNSAKNTPPAG